MRILYFGTGAFGLPSLQALADSRHSILGVVTAPDKPKGRDLRLAASPVKEWAVQHQKAVFQPARVNDPASVAQLRALGADIFVVIAYGSLLSRELLSIPSRMTLNVHSSLLPAYRGAAPIHWALLDGLRETGVTIMRMDEGLDTGDIVTASRVLIEPKDDFPVLESRLAAMGAQALIRALEDIEAGRAYFTPQDAKLASYARKLRKEDGHLDWKVSATMLVNKVRALRAWPVCYAFHKGRRLRILEAVVVPSGESAIPGMVVKASEREGLCVAAQEGLVDVKWLQLEGKKALPASEFLKGFKINPGEMLE